MEEAVAVGEAGEAAPAKMEEGEAYPERASC